MYSANHHKCPKVHLFFNFMTQHISGIYKLEFLYTILILVVVFDFVFSRSYSNAKPLIDCCIKIACFILKLIYNRNQTLLSPHNAIKNRQNINRHIYFKMIWASSDISYLKSHVSLACLWQPFLDIDVAIYKNLTHPLGVPSSSTIEKGFPSHTVSLIFG